MRVAFPCVRCETKTYVCIIYFRNRVVAQGMVEDAEKKTVGFTTRISMEGRDEQITTTHRRCNTTVQCQSLGSVTKLLPMATAMSNHHYFPFSFLADLNGV